MRHKNTLKIQISNPIKKEWLKPTLECLDITKTKSGDYDYDDEGSFWFITWGS